ncbi:unnamed protein product [Rotaria sp. Silwood2]|nr:unnamed protein product [Rotaria sp. Silwood2]
MNSGLSVLRTFRLLRVLKLVRFMPTLRQQLVLTQEDWHGVLYNGMKNTNAWAALYFIVLMTFGNYVLFNLLVAILVEGFSTDKESGTSNIENMTNRLEKIDPFTTQALLTGDVEQLPHPHELIIDESSHHKHKVKIMSIPKIATSNQHDSSECFAENCLKANKNFSSSTTLSFHTCIQSIRNESSKVSLSFQRRCTISSIKNNSTNSVQKIQDNLCENNSLTLIYDDNHRIHNNDKRQCLLNPIRRKTLSILNIRVAPSDS